MKILLEHAIDFAQVNYVVIIVPTLHHLSIKISIGTCFIYVLYPSTEPYTKKKMKERMLGKDKLVDVVATIGVVARFQCPLITKKIPLKVFTYKTFLYTQMLFSHKCEKKIAIHLF